MVSYLRYGSNKNYLIENISLGRVCCIITSMVSMKLVVSTIYYTVLINNAFAGTDTEPQTPTSFSSAKIQAKKIYFDNNVTFYCSCIYKPNERGSGGIIDEKSCGIKTRKNSKRAKRIEWEHIVPAAKFGNYRSCWKEGNEKCVQKNGKTYKGRRCCSKVDVEFSSMAADLYNLVPAAGEINGDRSNFQFGIIAGEVRKYGACNFEVNFSDRIAEPPEKRWGEIARAYLYMNKVWGMKLEFNMKKMYEAWNKGDPAEEWEIERSNRIVKIQKVPNPFLLKVTE